jgi:hypothetical protein
VASLKLFLGGKMARRYMGAYGATKSPASFKAGRLFSASRRQDAEYRWFFVS